MNKVLITAACLAFGAGLTACGSSDSNGDASALFGGGNGGGGAGAGLTSSRSVSVIAQQQIDQATDGVSPPILTNDLPVDGRETNDTAAPSPL